jgi:hypothetical protein
LRHYPIPQREAVIRERYVPLSSSARLAAASDTADSHWVVRLVEMGPTAPAADDLHSSSLRASPSRRCCSTHSLRCSSNSPQTLSAATASSPAYARRWSAHCCSTAGSVDGRPAAASYLVCMGMTCCAAAFAPFACIAFQKRKASLGDPPSASSAAPSCSRCLCTSARRSLCTFRLHMRHLRRSSSSTACGAAAPPSPRAVARFSSVKLERSSTSAATRHASVPAVAIAAACRTDA